MRVFIGHLLLLAVIVSCAADARGACSTFMLATEGDLLVGHNLDESPTLDLPGLVCVNKRGTHREGITWYELIAHPAAYVQTLIPFADKPSPKLSWRARFGSITFNSEGVDFPDGGVNEAGLVVFEMSLPGTRHKVDSAHPTLFIALWIQHQLDTCASVDEVIRNAHEINQQGWSWHYFVADRQGNQAIIEYLDGEVVVHTGAEVAYPVLCNTEYAQELTRLGRHHGFGAWVRSLFGNTPRFIRAARMLDAYDPKTHGPARDYAWSILKDIRIRGWNKWAILVDLKTMTVFFHTDRNRRVRSVAFASFDFSPGPAELLDIHADLAGDVAGAFVDYTYERNFEHAQARADELFAERFKGLESNGVTAGVYARRFADYSARMRGELTPAHHGPR
jgi:penicillin V acylase-like amidase (Ntn superfamily)